jgi:hypothetical protein
MAAPPKEYGLLLHSNAYLHPKATHVSKYGRFGAKRENIEGFEKPHLCNA